MTRQRLHEILQPARPGDKVSQAFDVLLATLIVVCTVVTVAETFEPERQITLALYLIESVVAVLFLVEYLCRIITADFLYPEKSKVKSRLAYIFSPLGIVDLLAILPYLLGIMTLNLTALRLIRLLSMFSSSRLGNYSNGLTTIGRALRSRKEELVSALVLILTLMIVAALLMCFVERSTQPEAFGDGISAFWWALETLTTIGYGDVYPITFWGKLLATVIGFLGVGVVAVPSAIIAGGYIEESEKQARAAAEQQREPVDEVLDELGITRQQAVDMYFAAIVRTRSIPLELSLQNDASESANEEASGEKQPE